MSLNNQNDDNMSIEEEDLNNIQQQNTTTSSSIVQMDGSDDVQDEDGFFPDDFAPEQHEDEEGTTPSIYTYEFHQESIFKTTAFSKRNTASNSTNIVSFYASQDDSASVLVYSLTSYQPLYQQQLKGFHDDSVVDVKLNFDGTLLASAGMDGTIGIYDVGKFQKEDLDYSVYNTEGQEQQEGNPPEALVNHKVQLSGPEGEIEWIQWHPKGNALLSASADATCWLWNVKKMNCMSVLAGHSDSISCGGFTADGKLVITGSVDATVRVWHPMQGNSIHTFEGDLFSQKDPIISMYIRQDDSKVVFVGNAAGELITCGIFDSPRVLQKYSGHTESIESIDYSEQVSHIIVTGSMDKTVGVWDDRINKMRLKLQCSEGVIKVKCSQRGPYVYSCGMDREVKIWDLRNGKCLDRFVGHSEGVLDFALVNNEEQLVSASDDGTSRIFETNLDLHQD
mmetsp:Transcript_7972/g.29707  ORF Transcript_7972/g.29707 Transcript_7972/m.29707 type:complete len:451 (-) Transcript_7972:108-1460(-)